MGTQILIEALNHAEAELLGDGTVKQVLIRAGMSSNGRYYAPGVLEAAVSVFEGVRTYNGHPSMRDVKERRERTPLELTGWIDGVVFENDALVGVRHFTNTQVGKDAQAMVEQVVKGEAPPTLIGSSINALGIGKEDKIEGKKALVVESITRAHSVDDVVSAAAGGGFEALVASASDDLVGALLEQLTYEEWFEARSDYTERFERENKKVRRNADVKRLKTESDKYRTELQEAQDEIQRLQEARDAAVAGEQQAKRAVLVVDALAGVKLPAEWRKGLREQLLATTPKGWEAIIKSELKKARQVNATPRVAVTGAGQRVAESVTLPPVNLSSGPLDGENAEQYGQRMQQVSAYQVR